MDFLKAEIERKRKELDQSNLLVTIYLTHYKF